MSEKTGFLKLAGNTMRSGDNSVHVAAAAAGFIVATGVSLASGIPVAWASPLYFVVGWPTMCLVIYLLARAYPVRAWRWTLSMMLGQVFSSIFFGGGPLMPVAMVYVTLLSIPQFYVGTLGAKAGMGRLDPAEPHEINEPGDTDLVDPELHKPYSENTDSQDKI